VTVLDAAAAIGGQYWRQPVSAPARLRSGGHRAALFARWRAELAAHPGVRIVTGAQVWSAARRDGAFRLAVVAGAADAPDRDTFTLVADALVLATGAHDRVLPFPGWQLPGVFTAGAAQTLARTEAVPVGRRVVVAGTGPFLLPVAASLVEAGATVVGIYEAARPAQLARGWLAKPWELAGAVRKAGELAGYIAILGRAGVPWRCGSAVVSANGDDAVRTVTLARLDRRWSPIPGSNRVVTADAVVVGHGFVPRLELAVTLGCALTPAGGQVAEQFVAVDRSCATSVPGVWAAGELTGIGGIDAALAEGTLAGQAAAATPTHRQTARARDRAAGFAQRLARAHAIGPGWVNWLTPDTVICRCEETTLSRLQDAVGALGAGHAGTVKLGARVGLGPCQGRMCARAVGAIVQLPPAALDNRPVALPIRLGEVARWDVPPAPDQSQETNPPE
jgi:thioredoxin reductase